MTRLPRLVGSIWFNTKPLPIEDLKDKVVLVDFWTYSCINCQRTLPYLKDWWQKYKDAGLIIVGIHTPEFEFEKEPQNVEQAIKDLGIEWPVVMDNDYINWNNFANHYWPAKYVADREGYIAYTHFGEGGYVETERVIQSLLKDKQEKILLPEIKTEDHTHGNVCFVPTPELYCGYSRGHLSNPEDYQLDQIFDYKKPSIIDRDTIALAGKFLVKPEYVESQEKNSELFLSFHATEVNLVIHPVGKTAVVEVFHNGQFVKEIKIEKPTLYNLLKSRQLVEGILSLRPKSGNFQAYAFTFSGCEQ